MFYGLHIIRYMKYDFSLLERRMQERGLTLAQLAGLTGGFIRHSTISMAFKRGTSHPSTALALCKALKIPLKDILPKGSK